MATQINYRSFESEELGENRRSSQLRISMKEVENLLLVMKDNHLTSFTEINPELKKKYDKLVKLVSLLYRRKSYDEFLKLAHKIFEGNADIVPGTLGSYVVNCVISSNNPEDDTNEGTCELKGIEQFKDSSVFFYNGFIVPLQTTNSETCIILVDEEKHPEFDHLSPDHRNFLNGLGKKKFKILSYTPGDKVYKEIYSEWDTEVRAEGNDKIEKKKGASLMFLLLAILIFALLFLSYSSWKTTK